MMPEVSLTVMCRTVLFMKMWLTIHVLTDVIFIVLEVSKRFRLKFGQALYINFYEPYRIEFIAVVFVAAVFGYFLPAAFTGSICDMINYSCVAVYICL